MARKKQNEDTSEAATTAPRRFILIEMDEGIAKGITAERVRRVAQGYTNAKGADVAGIGGGFRYAHVDQEMSSVNTHDVGAIADGKDIVIQFWLDAGLSIPFRLSPKLSAKLRAGISKPNVSDQATASVRCC